MNRNFWSANLLIKECSLKENLELSGTIKVPSHMATWLSPNGSVKKHSLYNKHPSACGESRKKNSEAHMNQVNHGEATIYFLALYRFKFTVKQNSWFCGWSSQWTEIWLAGWYQQLPLLGEGHFYYWRVWLTQNRTPTGDIWITKLLWCGSACPDTYTLHQGFGMFCKHCSRKRKYMYLYNHFTWQTCSIFGYVASMLTKQSSVFHPTHTHISRCWCHWLKGRHQGRIVQKHAQAEEPDCLATFSSCSFGCKVIDMQLAALLRQYKFKLRMFFLPQSSY